MSSITKDENRDDNNAEERPYYSIDAMKDLSDEELLDYFNEFNAELSKKTLNYYLKSVSKP